MNDDGQNYGGAHFIRRRAQRWIEVGGKLAVLVVLLWIPLFQRGAFAQQPSAKETPNLYLGFDRNEYPGDDRLELLRGHFAYLGYWLNNPPGGASNSWRGKRSVIRARGFGFLLLYNGRLDKELTGGHAAELGRIDAKTAVEAARREGFPRRAILYLDQEEGGRLLPEQRAYVLAWVRGVLRSAYRAGVYCSGIETGEGPDRISTAEDLLAQLKALSLASSVTLWVANDQCPPAPGCVPGSLHPPAASGIAQASVWQFAQSPRRSQFTQQCAATYAPDGNCYAPGLHQDAQSFIDLDVAAFPDPSFAR
jgi:hypothetical protein